MIRDVIRTRHPETVGQLARMLTETQGFEESRYVDTVKSMMKDGSLTLGQPSHEIYSVLDYMFALTVSGEFWLIFVLACTAPILIYLLPSQFPLSVFRWIFGAILICLPGYSTIKLLFPTTELEFPEQLVLSVGLTLGIVPIIGFVLNFTPWGIRFQPVITSLAAYTIVAVTAAASRNYLTLVRLPADRFSEEP